MSHPDHRVTVISLKPEAGQQHLSAAQMVMFQEHMNRQQDAISQYIQELAQKLGISEHCASQVWYLRGRSRWTQSLEDRLIKEHAEGRGDQVNMNEFGHD